MPSQRRLLTILLALPLVLAGCVTLPGGTTDAAPTPSASLPPEWYLAALAHDEGHNHSAIEEHMNASTPNFHLLGHDPLLTDHYGGKPAQGYACGGKGVRDDGRVLQVISSFNDELTFVLVDVTDASKPTKVGEFYARGMASYDADITPDGRFVVLAFHQLYRAPADAGALADLGALVAPAEPPVLGFRARCADGDERVVEFGLPEDAAVVQGVVLVDVTDPANPVFADWDATPGRNLHSVSTAEVDGETWVMASILGGAPRPPGTPIPPQVSTGYHGASYFVFYRLDDSSPVGAKLVRFATYVVPPATLGGDAGVTVPVRNGHTDIMVARHPGTQTLYAYAAVWEGGVLVLDMSTPERPLLVGQWTPPHELGVYPTGDGPCGRSAIHEVLPAPELWEGRHILFAGQECPTKPDELAPGGSIFVLDATDPSNIQQIGEWYLPADTGVWTIIYQASPHYVYLHERTLFVAHYHAGLWAVDVSDPERPMAVGVYMPTIPPPFPPERDRGLPFVEDLSVLADGTLVVHDGSTGVYTLRFDASDPAPPAPPYPYPE